VPIGLLIRRGSVLKAKLHMAKRLNKARAVTIKGKVFNLTLFNISISNI
jgi:hypothetical protein